jgi:hypothetical protein
MNGPNQFSTKWTPEQDEYVRQSYRVISARAIGAKIGFSKSAVIGRAHRIGLGKPYDEVFNTGTKYGTKPKGAICQRINVVKRPTGFARMRQEAPRVKKLPIPELNDSIIPLNGVGVKMWELGSTNCRWVVGEPKDLTFCGHDKKAGSSYCEDHHNWTVSRK